MRFLLISLFIIFVVYFIARNVRVDNQVQEFSAGEVMQNIHKPDFLLVDVREKNEYESGHIASSINIPLSLLRKNYKQLPSDKKLVLICRSGNRSLNALSFLKDQGYDGLINLKGGVISWQKSGYSLQN